MLGVGAAAAALMVGSVACEPPSSSPPPVPTPAASSGGLALETSGATVTPDGRYVAFVSSAVVVPGFVPRGGGGIYLPRRHVYRLDRTTGTTVPVSVDADGGPMLLEHAVAAPSTASMSDDGRYIAFATTDPHIVPQDVHQTHPPDIDTSIDVFVRDVVAGTTQRIELPGGADILGGAASARISGNGRWVVFTTASKSIDPADDNGLSDLYRWDRTDGSIVRVTRAAGGGATDKASLRGIPLDNGDVVFESRATNMGAGIAVPLNSNQVYVYLEHMATGTYEPISVSSTGKAVPSELVDASSNGSRVLFRSSQAAVPDDTPDMTVFLRDRAAGTTTAAIRDASGAVIPSSQAVLSANGRFIVMSSRNTNIVPGDIDNNTNEDLFVRDLSTGKKYQVDRLPNGSPGTSIVTSGYDLSNDGHTVVFATTSHSFGPDDGTIINRTYVERTQIP